MNTKFFLLLLVSLFVTNVTGTAVTPQQTANQQPVVAQFRPLSGTTETFNPYAGTAEQTPLAQRSRRMRRDELSLDGHGELQTDHHHHKPHHEPHEHHEHEIHLPAGRFRRLLYCLASFGLLAIAQLFYLILHAL